VALALILVTALAPIGIQAAVVRPVAGFTSDLVGNGSVANTIDGVLDFDAFVQLGPTGSAGSFAGPYTVSYELGGLFGITGMTLWNNAGSIELDGEGINAFTLVFRNGASTIGTYNGSALDVLAPQSFALAAAGVSAIDLVIQSNHLTTRTYVDFYEVEFEGTTVVPLPASFPLLATALVAATRFRKRR
jgi:hypothetical protein